MAHGRLAISRKSENTVLGSGNVYRELRDRQIRRNLDGHEEIARYRELQRLLTAKITYLDKIQVSRQGSENRLEATDITCRVIGEQLCVIGDMPGWYFYDSSLMERRVYAIGANGSLYVTDTSRERDSFKCVDDEMTSYSINELAQIADAIEASIAQSPQRMVDLMIKRSARRQS